MSRAWKDFSNGAATATEVSGSVIVTLIKIQGWAENSVEIASRSARTASSPTSTLSSSRNEPHLVTRSKTKKKKKRKGKVKKKSATSFSHALR